MITEKPRLATSLEIGQNKVGLRVPSVAVIGAAGQTGEFFTKTLLPVVPIVEAVVREHRWKEEAGYPKVRFHKSIERMMERQPEVIILATPNPVKETLEEIARCAQKPVTVVLSQNGIMAEEAQKAVTNTGSPISLVRASLWTNVSRNENGDLVYNHKKKKISLAVVDAGQADTLLKLEVMFAQAGFKVSESKDYRAMERSKLLANSVGSTSTVTGLPLRGALSDPKIITAEHRGLKDRVKIMEASGLDDTLPNIRVLRWAAKVPTVIISLPGVRHLIAYKIANERNNQLPAAARQINEGAKKVESIDYYHKAMINLGAKVGLEDPVDQAIWDILTRHQRAKDGFSLKDLEIDKRRQLFAEIFGLETKELFVKSWPLVTRVADILYKVCAKNVKVTGENNLKPVVKTLEQGMSVGVYPDHRSHTDHGVVVEELGKAVSGELRKFPIYILAGMKFDQELFSRLLGHAYTHPVVQTLTETDSEETRWRAHIINRRTSRIIDKLLKTPCIFVVYLEGGRSKTYVDGRVQLQEPAPGGSVWLTDSRFGLAVPVAITGTEKILRPGKLLPYRSDVAIEFCEPIKTEDLRAKGNQVPRAQRDKYLSRQVLEVIAAKLPPEETINYNLFNN